MCKFAVTIKKLYKFFFKLSGAKTAIVVSKFRSPQCHMTYRSSSLTSEVTVLHLGPSDARHHPGGEADGVGVADAGKRLGSGTTRGRSWRPSRRSGTS